MAPRFQLIGKEAEITRLGEMQFVLSSGSRRLVVHGMAGRFGGHAINWELGREREGDDQVVFVDAVCYSGASRAFQLAEMGSVVLGAGMELLKQDDPATVTGVEIEENGEDGAVVAKWGGQDGLEVTAPLFAGAHLCSLEK